MLNRLHRIAAGTALSLALLSSPPPASAQATAVPTLDANRFMGTWYEIERYPVKPENHCLSDAAVLYALGDKKDSFLVVTSCTVKNGNSDSWNAKGKFSNTGDGKLKLRHLLIFYKKYWVLSLAPDYSWALVGSPSHHTLWILSRTTTLPANTLAQIEATATAQGFNISKLKPMPQHHD